MNWEELKSLRLVEGEFIRSDRVNLVLYRAPIITTPSGGKQRGEPVALPPQVARLTPFKRRLGDFVVETSMGHIEGYQFLLLGYHDMDIERGDTFSYQGREYEIREVDPDRDVRTQALVDYFGKSNG